MRRPRELALPALSRAERAMLTSGGPRQAIGVHREIREELMSRGEWQTTNSGVRVWRLALRSVGAAGLRLEFRNFDVGEGKVWVYADEAVDGPYTGRGTFDNGGFWTGTIEAESATIEYEPAIGASTEGAPPFEIVTLSHQALSLTRRAPQASLMADAAACHLDASCYYGWQSAMSMVGKLAYEDGGLSYVCSGSLLGTRDKSFKPYLLTAGHCINNENAARSLEVYWTYQTASCGGEAPLQSASTKSTGGGHLLAYGTLEQGDYSLVLLQNVPKGVVFSGWDAGTPELSTPLVGVHHPRGSYKRISFGSRVADITANVQGTIAPASSYLQVLYGQGRVEPGSSGSPLFSSPGVVVGVLSYAPAVSSGTVCDINPFTAGYGRFSTAYPALKLYVEGLDKAFATPSTNSLNYSLVNGAGTLAQNITLTTESTADVTYRLRSDSPFIVVNSGNGAINSTRSAQASIAIDKTKISKPGTYTGTVTLLAGAADPKFINVTATVRVDQSNVIAAISPNPVKQSNGQWDFAVKLTETAGAATRITAMRINGVDYTGKITEFFGAVRIAAGGSVSAPLHAVNQPLGDQYFEFEGTDEAGGQQWYRVVTVMFQ